MWWWETPDRVEVDSEALVREVLDEFEPVADQLIDSATEWELEVQIGLMVQMSGPIRTDDDGAVWADVPTPSLAFTRRTLTRLGRLNCALDIDQYVSAPDDD